MQPLTRPFADQRGGVARVAEQRLEAGQGLLRAVGSALRVTGLAAQPAPAHAAARIEPGDRPVGAEADERAGVPDVARPERPPAPLRPERAAPRVGLVGRVVLHVQRLHRRADVLGGEPRQVVVLQRLDVLDAVHAAGHGARGPVGVERGPDGAVADGVGGAREAGAGEPGDDGRVALLGRPERHRAAAVRVGLVQPRRAGLDHAVDEELGGAAAPHPAALADQRQPGRDLVVGDVRLLVQRHDAARRSSSRARPARGTPRTAAATRSSRGRR